MCLLLHTLLRSGSHEQKKMSNRAKVIGALPSCDSDEVWKSHGAGSKEQY